MKTLLDEELSTISIVQELSWYSIYAVVWADPLLVAVDKVRAVTVGEAVGLVGAEEATLGIRNRDD